LEEGTEGSPKEDPFTIKLQMCFKNKREKEISRSKIGRKQNKNSWLRIGRRQKKKRKFLIKDRKKTKENIQKGLRTRQHLNNTKLSQENKKRKETMA